MAPTLQPGDHLLVWRPIRPVRVGQVLVYRDRFEGGLRVKRVVGVSADGTASIRGDNLVLSTDEADLGAVPRGQMRGVVVLKKAQGQRWRLLG